MACSNSGLPFSEETIERWYSSKFEDNDLLEIIVSCQDDIVSYLEGDTLSTQSISLLVHLLARASGCKTLSDRTKVYDILNLLTDSTLFNLKGIQLLTDDQNVGEHTFPCIYKDYLVLLQNIFAYMPSSLATTHIIGFIDLLKNKINDAEDFENKERLMDQVFDIKNSIMSNIVEWQKSKKDSKCKNYEDDMKPPESFRKVSVMPKEKDLLYQTTFLRRNKKFGRYADLEHYLDVQFRLYREDCISPIREAFEEFRRKNEEKRFFRLDSGRIYRDIQILKGTSTSLEHGEVFVVQLDPAHCKRIKWNNSKRLIFGSLLLLSFDNFNSTLFVVVSDADREMLTEKGQFKAQIFKTHVSQQIPRETLGIILEATSAYFEAYYHVLNAIQQIQDDTLPFQKYIVHCEKDVDMPRFLQRCQESTFDLLPVMENHAINFDEDLKKDQLEERRPFFRFRNQTIKPTITIRRHDVKLLETENWPSKELLNLDESQRQAFITALTKEFVLIQGPPGTGKTHLGLQIAKALLHNRHKWKLKPNDDDDEGNVRRNKIREPNPCLLVVCFTNHALDQFVEGIIDFLPENRKSEDSAPEVVRIGSQCKHPNVDKYSIKTLRKNYNRQERAYMVLREAEAHKHKYLFIQEIRKMLQKQKIVLSFHRMKEFMGDHHKENFWKLSEQAWLDWLHVSPKTWFEQVEKRRKTKKYDLTRKEKSEIEKQQDFIDVVDEDDYERTERSLDEDTEIFVDANTIGVDVENQLNNVMMKETNCQSNLPKKNKNNMMDRSCEYILREEADRVMMELRSSEIADIVLLNTDNLWRLPLSGRWKLYRYWLKLYLEKTREDLNRAEQNFNEIFKRYKNARIQIDEEIMRKVSVIAMTTTGAAKYNESLKRISPQITIIEEAAEVPEAHIVTAINPQCEHVILIGDHKQLEPKPAVRELAIKYNLSISLFERMLNNGLHYHCLERQHRMRPEISNLVRHMYPVLEDNENVHQYEDIKGVRQNLFFIDHNQAEQYNEDGKSFSNEFEANFISELCDYLLKQGYKGSEITILAAYTGQMFCIRRKMPRSRFEGVNISVLDNYQGEENEIILLSLVRSNENGDIGFLSRENRICVALSRAKKGLFILGNSSTLTNKSKHWQVIMNKLKDSKVEISTNSEENFASFGKALPLYCQNHSEKEGILAAMASDFAKAPDGGCERRCESRLDCGHACRYFCHPTDRNHKEYICEKLCWKHCEEGHICQKQCHFPDNCKCLVIMERVLECSHFVELQCHFDPKDHQCKVNVVRNLKCGHDVKLKCYIDQDNYECIVKVSGTREECGHEFIRYCHDEDFEHRTKCEVMVEKKFPTCDHTKMVACSYDLKKDFCCEIIKKVLECGHIKSIKCCQSNSNLFCLESCKKTCENGHICKNDCHYCSSCNCRELIHKTVPKCGHTTLVPCSKDVENFKDCREEVELTLTSCGHLVTVECNKKIEIEEAATSLYKKTLEKEVRCKQLVECEMIKCKHIRTVQCWKAEKYNTLKSQLGLISRSRTMPNFKCLEEVSLELECGHTKNVACWQKDQYQVEKRIHSSAFIKRYGSLKDIQCNTIVTVELECGHNTEVECCKAENFKATYFQCNVAIDVELVPCGHKVRTECYKKAYVIRNEVCNEDTTFVYPECQHETKIKCYQNPNFPRPKSLRLTRSFPYEIPPCSTIVEKMLDCGHLKSFPCYMKNVKCDHNCEKLLFCGHLCSDLCKNCQTRGIHSSCKAKCYKELFCGHYCHSTECLQCIPCSRQCWFSCDHSTCTRSCKDICKPCRKPCSWVCPHFKCTKTCAEECDRPLCAENCKITLPCGHICPGYCGEPCPKACLSCDANDYKGLSEKMLDEKCVTLRDCSHSFACTYLDEYMQNSSALVRRCPVCQTFINSHPRYDSLLKRNKRFIEGIKIQLKQVTGKSIHFPVVDLRFIEQFATYVGKFLTYIHIVNYTETDRNSQSAIRRLKEKGENLMDSMEHIPKQNFQCLMDLSNAVFSLHVDWIMRLCLKNKKLMEKEFNLENNKLVEKPKSPAENGNLQLNNIDVGQDTTIVVNGHSTSTLESGLFAPFYEKVENVKHDGRVNDNKVAREGQSVDETPQSRTEIGKLMSRTILTGHEIVQLVHDSWRNDDVKRIKGLTELLLPYIEGEPHVDDAMDYPQLTIAMGVHAADWTQCEAGHITPSVIPGTCHSCSDVEEIQWVKRINEHESSRGSSNKKGRRGKSKRGKTVPPAEEGTHKPVNEHNGFATSSFDQTNNESSYWRRGFIKNRGRGAQRHPFEKTQSGEDIRNTFQNSHYPDLSGLDNNNSSQRGRHNSYQYDREAVPSEENRYRGRGNRRPRRRGGRQGPQNTRSWYADSVRDSLFNFTQGPSQENRFDQYNDHGVNSRGRNRGRGRRRGGRNK